MPTVAQENGTENVILPLVILTTNMLAMIATELLATVLVSVRKCMVTIFVVANMQFKQKRLKLVRSAAEVRVMKSTGNAKTFQLQQVFFFLNSIFFKKMIFQNLSYYFSTRNFWTTNTNSNRYFLLVFKIEKENSLFIFVF